MGAKENSILYSGCVQFLSKYIIGKIRKFRFELERISILGIKSRCSFKNKDLFNCRIAFQYSLCSSYHVLGRNGDFLLEVFEVVGGIEVGDVC